MALIYSIKQSSYLYFREKLNRIPTSVVPEKEGTESIPEKEVMKITHSIKGDNLDAVI